MFFDIQTFTQFIFFDYLLEKLEVYLYLKIFNENTIF